MQPAANNVSAINRGAMDRGGVAAAALDVWLRTSLRGTYGEATREPMAPALADVLAALRSDHLSEAARRLPAE